MKIFGRSVNVKYYVDESRGDNGKLTRKPRLIKRTDEAVDLCLGCRSGGLNGASCIDYNGKKGNIVKKEYDVYADDVNVYTNYVREIPIGEDEANERLELLLDEWNEQEIVASPQLLAWCKLNGKKPIDVDVDKLKIALGIKESQSIHAGTLQLLPDNIFSTGITSGSISSAELFGS